MRSTYHVKLLACFLIACDCHVSTALANDSISALTLGGIELQKTNEIAMQSEVLKITPKRVEVDYVFENLTSKEIKALIAFPLPPTTFCGSMTWSYVQDGPEIAEEMQTAVDRKSVKLERHVRALLDGKDVTEKVKALGLMNVPTGSIHAYAKTINDFVMKAAAKPSEYAKLVGTGIFDYEVPIMGPGDLANGVLVGCFAAKWMLQATYTRHQVFPPKAKVKVSHRYRPLVGYNGQGQPNCSVYLNKIYSKIQEQNGIMMRKPGGNYDVLALEGSSVKYTLKPGANWAGSIGSFKLIVKGGLMTMVEMEKKAEVYFGDFVIEKNNFKPTANLAVDFFSHRQNAEKLVVHSDAPVKIDGPANLRTTPGGAQFMSIADGVKIKVLDVQGEWIKVQTGEKSGWTHSKNLRPIPDKNDCDEE